VTCPREPYVPSPDFVIAMTILMAIACVLLSGCTTPGPTLPKVVEVLVEKPARVPDWARRPVSKPMRADGTVGALLVSHEQRGDVIDLLNCRLALLVALGDGREIEKDTCE
jgi:starvation-inducible outer membrane lipoprotein